MRILFLSYVRSREFSDPYGWLERINGYIGILEALRKKHEVISIEQINYAGLIVHKHVHYHFLNLPKAGYLLRLHQYVVKQSPDLVFIHGMHFPLQLLHLRSFIGKGVRIIVQNHAERPSPGLKQFAQRIADRSISAYLFTAKEMGNNWLEQKIIRRPEKIREVMEASSVFSVSDKKLARAKIRTTAGTTFLWVGRLDANKDPLTVVKAFLAFAAENPGVRLYMIYQTEELLPDIGALLASYENPTVQLIGRVPHNELGTWFNAADYIISGSHYEGSGVAVCEAMSCGCIPILTRIESFSKMTGHGKCGILYQPGDSNDLLRALKMTLSLDKEKERERVLNHFQYALSFTAIAAQINEVLETL